MDGAVPCFGALRFRALRPASAGIYFFWPSRPSRDAAAVHFL